MKKRFQLPLFALVFFAAVVARAQTTVTWSATPFNDRISTPSNWTGGSFPSSDGDTELVFGPTNLGFIHFDLPTVQIHSLAFVGSYPSYHFNSSDGASLIIGSGGVSVPASENATVVSDSNIFIELAGGQTWDIGGHLIVRGMISDAPSFTASLTKTGSGTLRLEGHNNFAGDFTLGAGTLEIALGSAHEGGFIYVSPVGLGTLTLANNTTLRSVGDGIQLHNNISLGDNVVIDRGVRGDLELAGTVTVANANTTIKVAGEQPTLFTGIIDGPSGTHLTFTSANAEFGSAAFADTFPTGNIGQITADRAALFFFFNLPSNSPPVLHAVNNGYIGAAAPESANIPAPSPAALLARITSPSTFAGTFGLDTAPESTLIHNYTDNLDFSAFTHPAFRFGSHSDAIMSGDITPVDLGSTALYPFGGGSGHLGVLGNLADPNGKPASILVSNPHGTSPQYVIFRGDNTTTGTYPLDGVSAHLAVENAIAVLDSPNALPGGASGKFAFGADAPAYIGATETAFADFNTFLSHLAPGGHNALSVLGLDSHDAFEAALFEGVDSDNYEPRLVSQSIDLRNLASIYLGTASDVVLAGTVHAPGDGILKLTAVDDGRLAIASPLGSNVNSVEIGFAAGTAAEQFGDGTIEMIAPQTYAGGTTLRSGTLSVADSSVFDHGTSTLLAGPVGTGTLTVESGASEAILAANSYYVSLHNDIHLNAHLQLGSVDYGDSRDEHYTYLDFNRLTLYGDISGIGGLRILGEVELYGNNTYSGGTILSNSVYLGSDKSLGTGTLRIENFGGYISSLSAYGDLTLSNPIVLAGHLATANYGGTLTLAGDLSLETPASFSFYGQSARITGNISGAHALMVYTGAESPLWLTGTNIHTGGTQVNGGSVIFGNTSSIPTSGRILSLYSSYVGAAINTNVQSDFLDRFDKPNTNGSIGFDTTDVTNPIVVSENLDLGSFGSGTRLGTATAATLTGTITPAGNTSSPYEFGNGGGVLTVQSDLGAGRSINAISSTSTPLTLVLTGDNRNAHGLYSSGSFVRFDGAYALPSTGNLVATEHGYIGYTENTGLTPDTFLARWGYVGYDAIVGFDSADINSPRTITDPISLAASTFAPSTYIGTSTAVNLNGTLTPFGSTLYLTGVGTGQLEVSSIIGDDSAASLVVGTFNPVISGKASVTLSGANTYTGGTDLFSTHLILGHASALGTGTLRVGSPDSRMSVNPSASGATIANNIETGSFYYQLTLDGEKPFTLSGEISGAGSLRKTGSSTVTLSGDNADLSGEVVIENGKLVFAENTSAGTGGLNFWSELGIAKFLGNAPVIGPVSSFYAGNEIHLADNSALTVNLANSYGINVGDFSVNSINSPIYPSIFYGGIHGQGASVTYTTAPDTVASIWLYGPSTYTGGTTINSGVTVVAHHQDAFGTTGTITVNGGHLSTASDVTLTSTDTRPIVFTAGTIGGNGTISFHSSLIVTDQLALAPGNSVGKLTLQFESAAALVFNSGGTYRWELADATGAAGTGWDLIHVAGNVDIAALASANDTFNITLHTIDSSGLSGYAANFNPNNSYSWAILTATSITNFDPAKFNLFAASTTFLNDTAGGTFSLSLENNTILLNFTPVPEPSTWALMITGLAAIVLTAVRRRRA